MDALSTAQSVWTVQQPPLAEHITFLTLPVESEVDPNLIAAYIFSEMARGQSEHAIALEIPTLLRLQSQGKRL